MRRRTVRKKWRLEEDHIALIAIVVVVVFVLFTAAALAAKPRPMAVTWSADDGLPLDTFEVLEPGYEGVHEPWVVDDENVIYVMDFAGFSHCLGHPDVFSASSQDAVAELVAKPTALHTDWSFGFSDGVKSLVATIRGDDGIGFAQLEPFQWIAMVPMDTTGDFHTFRVEKHGQSSVRLFVDDEQVLEIGYNFLPDAMPAFANSSVVMRASREEGGFLWLRSYDYFVGGTEFPEQQGQWATVQRRHRVRIFD